MTERVAAQSATFVRASKPGSDEFFDTAQDRLRVEAGEAQTFLRYRIELPLNKIVSTAVLVAHTEEDDFTGTADARAVEPDSGPYREMTWNTRPNPVAGSADRAATVEGGELRFPVTDDVVAAVSAEQRRVAFRISAGSATKQWLVGPNGGRGWPRLLLTFETAPRVPVDLSPDGVVSKARPWHSWLGHPDAYEIQLQFAAEGATWNATTGFTSPVHDTGAVVREGDFANMAEVSPGWAGLADGDTLDWSVRQHLPAGWSKWAPPATVTRAVIVDPVITNPGSTTADSSPPVVWTPPPGQTAWQVIVDIDGDRQADSGKRPGADNSWTPDMGGDDAGTVYRIRLRTWDDKDRVPMPGDPSFGQDELLTTFTPTPTVAPLSTLQLEQVEGLPAVAVTWSRSSGLPDEVVLRGDGPAVRLDGTESGALVWTFSPNRDLEIEGRAVVNREHSNVARTRSLRTRVTHVWLVDPDTERGCVLSGVDGLSVSYGDVSVVHTPIDAAVLLRRTLALRNIEGTITGRIATWPGRTNRKQVDDVLWLRDRPRKVLRLIMGDLNVPVVCSSLQPLFDPELSTVNQLRHIVTFDFSHAGGR